MTAPRIDFARIASVALQQAESLLSVWVPGGKVVGQEYKGVNPTRADRHEGSFSINIRTGAWGDFATNDAGLDLVSLYAYLEFDDDNVKAAVHLARELGIPDAAPLTDEQLQGGPRKPPRPRVEKPKAEAKPKRESNWRPVLPVPENAPEPPVAHEFRGRPELRWAYHDAEGRLLGYVCRFKTSDGGKDVIPLTFCRHVENGRARWSWMSFPEPRPLYGLDLLAQHPQATVLLVEGEKCADAGNAHLLDHGYVLASWPGGGKAIDKADWSPLAGRRVITWADCDAQRRKLSRAEIEAGKDPEAEPILPAEQQPGVKAMAKIRDKLAALGCELLDVMIPEPGEVPGGWDIADAINEGMVGEALAQHIEAHAELCQPAGDTPEAPEPPEHLEEAAQALADQDDAQGSAKVLHLVRGGRGDDDAPDSAAQAKGKKQRLPDEEAWRYALKWERDGLSDCLANCFDILLNRPEWQGVVAFDEFAQRIVKLKPPPYAGGVAGEWLESDSTYTAIWLTRREGVTPSSVRVLEAVDALARLNTIHPVRDWLTSLPAWDGVERLSHWITDYLGAEPSEYVRLVSRWYLIGMVKRVMEPGCQHDYTLVLEGSQGKRKSSAFRALADPWFDDTDINLENKDSMSHLQGVWIHEFAELGSFARSEEKRQKSYLTRRWDKYRPSYARLEVKVPRQTVFGGTTNEWEWNKDPTGGRRFWPVMCTDKLNTEGLRAAREQLFAEALAAYRAKEQNWPTEEQQAELFDPEQLKRQMPEALVDVLHDWVFKQIKPFSMAEALMQNGIDASKLTRDMSTRAGIALRQLGCRRVEKRNGMTRYWYEPPPRESTSPTPPTPADDPAPEAGTPAQQGHSGAEEVRHAPI